MGRAVSLSNSPLANPKTLIHLLASELQDYLYLPDPSPFYVVLGTIAGNIIKGKPIWLMLVGASSCGKGMVLNSLMGIPRIVRTESISGEPALLSGVRKKDRDAGATGGLLMEIGGKGMLVMEDFTSSMMGMGAEKKQELLNAFRQIYNGEYSRSVGSGGGKHKDLEWIGKLGFLAGGTLHIDQLHTENAALGERWLYYRFPSLADRGYGAARAAINNRNPDENKKTRQDMIRAFFDCSDLDWDKEEPSRELTGSEYSRMIDMATVVVKIRAATIRDRYGREHEIIDVVDQSELPPRLAEQLAQLYLGLERIGLPENERWELICKVAMDSAPKIKTLIVQHVWQKNGTGMGMEALRYILKCGLSTVKRTVEDLEAYEVVEVASGGMVRLSEWARENLNKMGMWEEE